MRNAVKKFPFFHPFSRRLHICLLCMAGFCCTTFMRMHIAISMTCMINSTALAIDQESHAHFSNITTQDVLEVASDGVCEPADETARKVVVDYGGDLVWTSQQQNLIFSGTFWGSLITVLPSMFFINRYSPRLVLQVAVGVYVVATLLTPYVAVEFGAFAVFVLRFVMGLGEGFILPANNAILANWFPSAERSTAVSLFTTGNQMAGAGGNPVAASLCASSLGWPSIFYFAGTVATVWSIVWSLTSSNQPSKCKTMTRTERAYLEANVVRRSNKTRKSQHVPYAKILTSAPFWAQLQCQFVINSIVTLFQIYLPSYFKDVLHLGVIANGTYTSIPNVANFAFKLVWGIAIDKAKERKMVTGTFAVKLSQSIANFGSAAILVLIAFFVDCTNPTTGFLLFCLLYCCMGTFVSGFYTSLLSLAPRYTATMSSISVFCAMLGRLATPAIVGLIKKEGTLSEWRTLFLVCVGANLVCGTLFVLFGSGDLQEWGVEEEEELKEEEVATTATEMLPRGKEDEVEMVDPAIPDITINEITLTTEEAERFQRRIREDSMCL